VTYTVPKPKWSEGWKNYIFGGWQLSTLMNFHARQPFDETRFYLNLVGNPFAGVNHAFSASGGATLWVNPTAFCDPNAIDPNTKLTDPGCVGSTYGNVSRNKYYGPGYGSVDFSIFKNIPIKERVTIQLRTEFFNLYDRINLASGVGAVSVGGVYAINFNTCQEDFTTHRCAATTSPAYSGFGYVTDTFGDFNGAPGIRPGEAFNTQPAINLIF